MRADTAMLKQTLDMIGQYSCVADSNLYSEQWHYYISAVSESCDCAKLDQSFCPNSPDPFPSFEGGVWE